MARQALSAAPVNAVDNWSVWQGDIAWWGLNDAEAHHYLSRLMTYHAEMAVFYRVRGAISGARTARAARRLFLVLLFSAIDQLLRVLLV